ncbi:MAG TPA: molybdopterin cofactor-binding domain-containing protein [Burkholderiales bacterium]|nr:molybdopterin cofactor-binding domain-containing protein [Burkholderiales bacterium]
MRKLDSRRDFLKTGGALIVGVALPGAVTRVLGQGAAQAVKPPLTPDELDSWIAIRADGGATAFFGKMDMGQGVDVAIGQIVAEELDLPFERVDVVMADTALTCNQGGASGSTGIQMGGKTLRLCAAEARRMLLERAAQRLSAPVEQLSVAGGVVSGPGGRRVGYGELIGGDYFHHKLEWNKLYGNGLLAQGTAKPKPPSGYKVVGQSPPQKVITEKAFGRLRYVTEVRVDGMLHARVIRPPTAGCGPVAIDESSIKDIAGARVVRDKDFVAVVAGREWDAVRAAERLKVQWAPACQPFPPMDKLHAYIRGAKSIGGETPVRRGDVDAALGTAARMVEAEYEWPLQSHASMGPACAVADVRADGATIWSGTQKSHFARNGTAKLVGLPPEKVRVIWIPGPGSYGRNDAGDAAHDAALISKLIGRPVRLQYMRHDATAWDPKGPAAVYRARAALDADGNIVAYDFFGRGFSRQDVLPIENDPKDTLAGQMTGYAPKGNVLFQTPAEKYEFANKRCGWECVPPLLERNSPLRTGHLRDPLGAETHFASESFIDELAHAAGADPVAFRLKYLKDPRHVAIVKAAAEKAGWSARPYPNPDRGKGAVMTGRGFSYTERNGTLVAMVAEVEVERASGRVWCRRFTVAHDCGLIINPKGLELTIEGNVMQALSRTLFEEVRFDQDRVDSVDWASYPIAEIRDAPEKIDIVLINRPEIPASGGGEPSTRTVPAAIANAIFDATGVRLRKAPLTPERVQRALATLA